jgi:hypothetical protein
LSHCRSVQGLTLRIRDTCSRVRRDDHVDGSDAENDIVDLVFPIIYTNLTEVNGRCNMEENVTQDALKLAKNIQKSLPPDENKALVVVNILVDSRDEFSLDEYPSIFQSFGYRYDKTPDFLEKNGVIEAKNEGKWYVDIVDTNDVWVKRILPETRLVDPIALTALKKKYIKDDQIPKYYYEATYWGDAMTNVYSWGPKKHGQMAILINRKKLEDFINWFSGLKPKFNEGTGLFEFLGETAQIDGKIEKKSFQLLLDNINSIVTKKEFYEVRGKKDYEAIYKGTGILNTHDALEKIFTKLREKIESNPKFRQAIKFVQKDGFGIFINEKVLLISKS